MIVAPPSFRCADRRPLRSRPSRHVGVEQQRANGSWRSLGRSARAAPPRRCGTVATCASGSANCRTGRFTLLSVDDQDAQVGQVDRGRFRRASVMPKVRGEMESAASRAALQPDLPPISSRRGRRSPGIRWPTGASSIRRLFERSKIACCLSSDAIRCREKSADPASTPGPAHQSAGELIGSTQVTRHCTVRRSSGSPDRDCFGRQVGHPTDKQQAIFSSRFKRRRIDDAPFRRHRTRPGDLVHAVELMRKDAEASRSKQHFHLPAPRIPTRGRNARVT